MQGSLDIIASDHAPHSYEEKSRADIRAVPAGIPGLETCLPLFLTRVNEHLVSLEAVVRHLSTNPARIFGLKNKGALRTGYDADLTLIDLGKEHQVNPDNFFSKAKYSPFEKLKCRGSVEVTICRGETVYQNGEIMAKQGSGRILERDP